LTTKHRITTITSRRVIVVTINLNIHTTNRTIASIRSTSVFIVATFAQIGVVTSNGRGTEISSTKISIGAVLVGDSHIRTSGNVIAQIGGTIVTIVTIDFGVRTTAFGVATIDSARIEIVTTNRSVGTSRLRIARIRGTFVVVVAIYGRG